MTLKSRIAGFDVARLEAVMEPDRGAAIALADLGDALPERVLRRVGPKALDDLEHLTRRVARCGFDHGAGCGLVQRIEARDDLTLGLVFGLGHPRPSRLEQSSQVPALPAADLEGTRAPGMERATEWRGDGVRPLAAREVARNRAGWVRLGDRTQERDRVRVLGVG